MDFLIKNGTISDPAQHKTWKGDNALVDGKIAAPSENHQYRQVIDAEGCIVTSGLIRLSCTICAVLPKAVCRQMLYLSAAVFRLCRRRNCRNRNVEHIYRTIVANARVRFLNLLLAASGGQSNNQYPENLDPALMVVKKKLWNSLRVSRTTWLD